MGSAAQSFRYARLRRSRAASAPGAEQPIDTSSAKDALAETTLEEKIMTPRTSGAVQPLVIAGLAPSDLGTVTGVSGVSGAGIGPLRLEQRPREEKPVVDPPVFLDR